MTTPDSNYGVIIAAFMDFKGNPDPTISSPDRTYISSEYTDKSLRQKLLITYNTQGINYSAPATLHGKNIALQVNAERVKLFISTKGSYVIAVSDSNHRHRCSFQGSNESWYEVPASKVSNGLHIISIRAGEAQTLAKLLFVK